MRRNKWRTRIGFLLYDRKIEGQWFGQWKKSFLEVNKYLNGERNSKGR